jgi:hypothetical protein
MQLGFLPRICAAWSTERTELKTNDESALSKSDNLSATELARKELLINKFDMRLPSALISSILGQLITSALITPPRAGKDMKTKTKENIQRILRQ